MSITLKKFEASNDMCVLNPNDSERAEDDVDTYFLNADYELEKLNDYGYFDAMKQVDLLAEEASEVAVFEKKPISINPEYVVDYIIDHMCDNFSIEDSEHIDGFDELKIAVEEFNKKQSSWVTGSQIGFLDFSKELKNHLIAHTLAIPHLEKYLEEGNAAHFDFDNMITFSDGQFIVEMAEPGGGYSVFDIFNDLQLAREYAVKLTPENEHVLRLEFTGSDLDKASEALGMVEA